MSLPDKASAALLRLLADHADLSPDACALVGVSGGRDSVALLDFLVKAGWRHLVVVHLNHGLRGRESGQDAAFVRRLAQRHGLRCVVQRVDVAGVAKQEKRSTETAARRVRDALFVSTAIGHGTRYVFLAHHAEDQAETILANLLRGTGSTGLRGMTPSAAAEDGLIKLRPLLQVRRGEIDDYLTVEGLGFREDSTNAKPAHRRNRLRKDALPLLSTIMQRDVTPLLLRAAELASQDDDCLNGIALEAMRSRQMLEADGALRIPRDWAALHGAIQSRIIRWWLVEQWEMPEIGRSEVTSVLGMLQPEAAAKVNLPGGHHVRRKARKLRIEKALQ